MPSSATAIKLRRTTFIRNLRENKVRDESANPVPQRNPLAASQIPAKPPAAWLTPDRARPTSDRFLSYRGETPTRTNSETRDDRRPPAFETLPPLRRRRTDSSGARLVPCRRR